MEISLAKRGKNVLLDDGKSRADSFGGLESFFVIGFFFTNVKFDFKMKKRHSRKLSMK